MGVSMDLANVAATRSAVFGASASSVARESEARFGSLLGTIGRGDDRTPANEDSGANDVADRGDDPQLVDLIDRMQSFKSGKADPRTLALLGA